jgi:hypothetical protein
MGCCTGRYAQQHAKQQSRRCARTTCTIGPTPRVAARKVACTAEYACSADQSEHRAAPARSNMRSNMRSNARQHDHDRHSRMLGWAHPRAFDSAGRCQMHAEMRLTAPGAVKCTLEVRVVISPWPLHVRGAFVIAVRSHTALLATTQVCHYESQNCLYTCLVHVENANASMALTSS